MTKRTKRWLKIFSLGMMGCLIVLFSSGVNPSPAKVLTFQSHSPSSDITVVTPPSSARSLIAQGKQLSQSGQLSAATEVWQRALSLASSGPEHIQIYRYLGLTYQGLGLWHQAERSLTLAFEQLEQFPDRLLQAQLLNTQGRLQLNLGQVESALASWQASEDLYQALSDWQGVALSQLNQAQALRILGHYRQAQLRLERLAQTIDGLDSPLLKASLQCSLGSTLLAVGDLQQAHQLFEESLAIAKTLDDAETIAVSEFQLGNINKALDQIPSALTHYKAAEIATTHPKIVLEAQLSQLQLLALADPAIAMQLLPTIQADLNQQAPSRWSLYGQIHLVNSWMDMTQGAGFRQAAPNMAAQLAETIKQARQIEDSRAEALALNQLGKLYEKNHQWRDALTVTEQSLGLATQIRSGDILVKDYWQKGRLLTATKQFEPAIAAYEDAVEQLQRLRQDLVAMNPEVQFSFRDQVEPIYRELAQLLFQAVENVPERSQQSYLHKAQTTIESLQLAELQNFFREACKTYDTKSIDSIDQQATVVYSVVLGSQLEVILARPGQPLKHHRTKLTQTELTDTFNTFRQTLNPAFVAEDNLAPAQRVYDWLLRPFEADLSETQTLVFVLDDFLRDIPMAALHDGHHYLIENYAVVLTPGLQLFESVPLPELRLETLAAGLTESTQGFSALPGVATEIAQITQETSAKTLVDQRFTRENLKTELEKSDFSLLHLGTHGQFSSQSEDTFLLTWDDRIGIRDLRQWLSRDQTPLELMILSACQTAKGDRRATLGLAGLTLQAGARSAIATLWAVQDRSTSELMTALYENLAQRQGTRAEILRQAQLQLLHSDTYQHPYYWAGFILVGNWL